MMLARKPEYPEKRTETKRLQKDKLWQKKFFKRCMLLQTERRPLKAGYGERGTCLIMYRLLAQSDETLYQRVTL